MNANQPPPPLVAKTPLRFRRGPLLLLAKSLLLRRRALSPLAECALRPLSARRCVRGAIFSGVLRTRPLLAGHGTRLGNGMEARKKKASAGRKG